MIIKARAQNGRLVLDEPTALPDGAVLEMVPADHLDDDERQRLDEAVAESEDDIKAGRVYSAEDVLTALRRA